MNEYKRESLLSPHIGDYENGVWVRSEDFSGYICVVGFPFPEGKTLAVAVSISDKEVERNKCTSITELPRSLFFHKYRQAVASLQDVIERQMAIEEQGEKK